MYCTTQAQASITVTCTGFCQGGVFCGVEKEACRHFRFPKAALINKIYQPLKFQNREKSTSRFWKCTLLRNEPTCKVKNNISQQLSIQYIIEMISLLIYYHYRFSISTSNVWLMVQFYNTFSKPRCYFFPYIEIKLCTRYNNSW